MKRCISCVSPETYPKISFNEEGMCNYCQGYMKAKELGLIEQRSEEDLREALLRFKKNNGYDCMVLFSGGKDSTFSLLKIKEWGLKPLAFTKDCGSGPSEACYQNMNKAIRRLSVDHIIYKQNLPLMKDFFHFLIKGEFVQEEERRSYSYVCKVCHFFLVFEAARFASNMDIPVIVDSATSGQRISEDYLLHVDSGKFKQKRQMCELMLFNKTVEMIQRGYRILQKYPELKSVEDIFGDFCANYQSIFHKVQLIYPMDYFHHSVEEMKNILRKDLEWTVPGDGSDLMGKGKDYIASGCDFWKIFFHLSLKNVGYHAEYASINEEIRRGKLTRDQSMKAFTESMHSDEEILGSLLDLNFSESEAAIMLSGLTDGMS